MGKKCGVSDGPVLVAGELAGYAILGKIFSTWSLERLVETHQYNEEELSKGWDTVSPQGRAALASRWRRMNKGADTEEERATLLSLMNVLSPPTKEAAEEIAFYAFGRAILADIEADEAR